MALLLELKLNLIGVKMAIHDNFEFKGLAVNGGYIKIGTVSLDNRTPKKWSATIHKKVTSDGDTLESSESFKFDYTEGQDPLKQAYEILSETYKGEMV